MKKYRLSLPIVILCCFVITKVSAQQKAASIDKKIENLLSKMTLEEKVGQMTQVTLQVVTKTRGTSTTQHELDPIKLEEAIIKYHVGSILNVYDVAHTVDHWHKVITAIQDLATKKTRLGVPVIYGIDAIHGANYTLEATLFPQSLGMAATWNLDLSKKEGEITAFEVRASGIPWNFNPVLGVGRNPLWPRLWETYGEDPHLVSVMGKAYVKGLEGDNNDISAPDKVAACMKHYLGYSVPLSGKDRTPAWIPKRMLREIFLTPFKGAVEAGVHTVMINSSDINGIPVHSSYHLLTEVLRNQLGFKGFTVSDWADIINLYERDKIATSNKEAVRMAVMAGVDMSMVPYDFSFYNDLLELVKEGEIPVSRIDEAVERILRVKIELGLFENPYPNKKMKNKMGSKEFAAVALQVARESITLLKNENNLLPLAKNKKVLVTGPTATSLVPLNGGWTYTWQGTEEALYPKDKNTILEAIEEKVGKQNLTYIPGTSFDKEIDIQSVVEGSKNADVAIVCLGENAYCETPGNINDLTLPKAQLKLAEALEQTGIPVVLVLVEGRPRIINRIVDDAGAILMAYLPGNEGGLAVADVLFGDFNPCGKLPITYPRYHNALYSYDHKYNEVKGPNKYDPQFPFGHGLSYTTFEYSNLVLDKKKITTSLPLTVKVDVKNTGKRPGKEVVILYLSDLVRSVTPPVRQVKGFKGVWLERGQSETVIFTLTKDDLAFVGRDNKWVVEPGEFKVTLGDLSEIFVLE